MGATSSRRGLEVCDRRPMRRSLLAVVLGAASCRAPPPEPHPQPRPDAITLLQARCERGEGAVCLELAAHHARSGDPRRGVAYAQRACELASARGCVALAEALERGELVPTNEPRALELRVQACLGGLAEGCRSAAQRLPEPQAAEFRARACAAGDASSCPERPDPPPPEVDPRDQAAVTLALADRRDALRACHAAVLSDRPGLRGRVVLEVAIGPEELARAAAVIEGLDPTLDRCVAQVAADAAYRPPVAGGIVIVRHALRFDP